DAAASALPDAGPLVGGTFKPTDVLSGAQNPDPFAPGAPTPATTDQAAPAGAATFATQFNGLTPAQANGTWALYIVDDSSGDAGSVSGGWSLNISQTIPPTTTGQLIISEFRLRGPSGANDEFIELYNTTGATLTTQSADASAGLAVAASD